MPTKQPFSQDAAVNAHFRQLPVYLQECLMQSGVRPENAEQLDRCAEHLMQPQK